MKDWQHLFKNPIVSTKLDKGKGSKRYLTQHIRITRVLYHSSE